MIYSIPTDAALWEVAATIEIMQALGAEVGVPGPEHRCLVSAAGLPVFADLDWVDLMATRVETLNYAKAYRAVESSVHSYVSVLAQQSGLNALRTRPPCYPTLKTSERVLAVCTESPHTETRVDDAAWREVVKLLRTYDLPLRIVGPRLGGCALREDEFTYTVAERLQAVADAVLVVGTPGEYLWAAAGMEKRIAVLYPDSVPAARWFHFAHDRIGRVRYEARRLRIPELVAGLRMLIDKLP